MASNMPELPLDGGSETEEALDKDEYTLVSSCLSLDDGLLISKRGTVHTFRSSPGALSPPVSLFPESLLDEDVPMHTPPKRARFQRSHSTPCGGGSPGFELDDAIESPDSGSCGLTPIFATNPFLDTPKKRKAHWPYYCSQASMHSGNLVRSLQSCSSLRDDSMRHGFSTVENLTVGHVMSVNDSGISEGLSVSDTTGNETIKDEIEEAIKMIRQGDSRPPTPDVFGDDTGINLGPELCVTGNSTYNDNHVSQKKFQLLCMGRLKVNMLPSPFSGMSQDARKTPVFSKTFDLGKISALKGSCKVPAIHKPPVKCNDSGAADTSLSAPLLAKQNDTLRNQHVESSDGSTKLPVPFTGLRPKRNCEQANVAYSRDPSPQIPIGIARPMPAAVSTDHATPLNCFSSPGISTTRPTFTCANSGHNPQIHRQQHTPVAPKAVFLTPMRNVCVLNGPFRIVSVPGVGALSPPPLVYINPIQTSVVPIAHLQNASMQSGFQDNTQHVQMRPYSNMDPQTLPQPAPTVYTVQTSRVFENTTDLASRSSDFVNKEAASIRNISSVTTSDEKGDGANYLVHNGNICDSKSTGFTCIQPIPVGPSSTMGMAAVSTNVAYMPSIQTVGYPSVDQPGITMYSQPSTATGMSLPGNHFLVQPSLGSAGITPLYSVSHQEQTPQSMYSHDISASISRAGGLCQPIHQPPVVLQTSNPRPDSQTTATKEPSDLLHCHSDGTGADLDGKAIAEQLTAEVTHGLREPAKEPSALKIQTYDIFSLQIGACKVSWPDCNSQRPLSSQVKIVFSERKIVYEFEMQDEFDRDGTASPQFLMLIVEISLQDIVGLMGRHSNLALELGAAPSVAVNRRGCDTNDDLVADPPANRKAYKVLPTIEFQLETSPYHWITLMGPLAEDFQWRLGAFDKFFNDLQLQAFVVNSEKLLNQSCDVTPNGKQSVQEKQPSSHPALLGDNRLRKGHGWVGRCACMRGCQYSRCSCVLNLRLCTQRCACINKYHCNNPLNQLANLGIDPDDARADACLVFNLNKVQNFREYLSAEVTLPCCKIPVAKQHLFPGLTVCPNSGCDRAYCYSWCSESLCDEDRDPRNHCLDCNKCMSSRATHCFDCGECYVPTARNPVCRCNIRAAKKHPPEPLGTISVQDLIKRDSVMNRETHQTKGASPCNMATGGSRIRENRTTKEITMMSTGTKVTPPDPHHRKRTHSGPPSCSRHTVHPIESTWQSDTRTCSTSIWSHARTRESECSATHITGTAHSAEKFTEISPYKGMRDQTSNQKLYDDDVFLPNPASKDVHVEITQLGSRVPKTIGKGTHILMPVTGKGTEANVSSEGVPTPPLDDDFYLANESRNERLEFPSGGIGNKLNFVKRSDRIAPLSDIYGGHRISIRGGQVKNLTEYIESSCTKSPDVEISERPVNFMGQRRSSLCGGMSCMPSGSMSSLISQVYSRTDRDSCVVENENHERGDIDVLGEAPRGSILNPELRTSRLINEQEDNEGSFSRSLPLIVPAVCGQDTSCDGDSEDTQLRGQSPEASAIVRWL